VDDEATDARQMRRTNGALAGQLECAN